MSIPSDPESAAFLTHILTQTRENVAFLASHNYLSPTDAAEITSRLSAIQHKDSLVDGVQSLAIGPPRDAGSPPRRIPPPLPRTQRARALWAYNEDGQEPNDLSFSAGEIVEIVDETNADWWTGKCRGRQGLFPSNHVEKIGSSPAPFPMINASSSVQPMPMSSMPPMPPMQAQPGYNYVPAEKPAYRPFVAVNQAANMPPPVGVNTVGLQQEPQQEHKKSKFGKLGNTMAQSAAGGVGFGAGAAIGSGIINSIF